MRVLLDLRRTGYGVGAGAATLLLQLVDLAQSPLVFVVDKMAPWSVGAEADRVECAAKFGFVLGMASQRSEFVAAVGELTLVAVFAVAILLVRSAQFGLVSAGVDISGVLLLLLSCGGHHLSGIEANWFRNAAV